MPPVCTAFPSPPHLQLQPQPLLLSSTFPLKGTYTIQPGRLSLWRGRSSVSRSVTAQRLELHMEALGTDCLLGCNRRNDCILIMSTKLLKV